MEENKGRWKNKRKLVPKGKPIPINDEAYVTPRGGDIELTLDPTFGMWIIKVGSGAKPKSLEGKFTEENRARKAVEQYLNTYWKNRT